MRTIPINGNVLVCRVKKEKTSNLLYSKEEYYPFYCILQMSEDLENSNLKIGDYVHIHFRGYFHEIEEDVFIVSYKDLVAYILDK